jgi:hypothetical protein
VAPGGPARPRPGSDASDGQRHLEATVPLGEFQAEGISKLGELGNEMFCSLTPGPDCLAMTFMTLLPSAKMETIFGENAG